LELVANQAQPVSAALAASLPEGAVAQIGRVFQGSTFCLRALQDAQNVLWFKGNEVAEALGYAAPHKAVCDHVHKDRRCKLQNIQFPRCTESVPLTKYEQEATWITEPGLYQLLIASKTEVAEQFKLWFTGEVLPQLAHTGSYNIQPQIPTALNDELQALQHELLAAQAAKERQLTQQIRVQTKLMGLELALKALQAHKEHMGVEMPHPSLQMAVNAAINAATRPANVPEGGCITAGDYLRMRGHSEAQVPSLQVTFGHMLKAAYERMHGKVPEPQYYSRSCGVTFQYCYNTQEHRELLNGTYQLLTLTDNYRKQVPNSLLALNSLA
jgi:prophage antirepressor-like protein